MLACALTSAEVACVQERATKISHGNTARHAKDYGDGVLGKICGHIASDEGRHEIAYSRIVEKFFELCAPAPPPPLSCHICKTTPTHQC